MHLFLGVPESSRQGLFKILAVESKEAGPTAFVPSDAIKFQRIRIDGQKAFTALEKMLNDISPQIGGTLNWILETANTAAKEKDPSFDVKKNLIGNLGDDIISYEKAPKGKSLDQLRSPPSLFLLGSPHPEELAQALRGILVFLGQQSGGPTEREFLGRKIYSVPLPNLPLPTASPARGGPPRTLSYAAGSAYVVMSTDAALLEEYLRSSDAQGKSLKETAGLADATQKVGGSSGGLFGYENQAETMRTAFELFKKLSGSEESSGSGPLGELLPFAPPSVSFKQWLDFSLLPPYEKVAKYFYFTVYAGSANVDGLSLKVFSPVSPAIKSSLSVETSK
jgi:hypothetical protein